MPDAAGNPTPAELAAILQPYYQGPLGQSPATQAGAEAFRQQALPMIQQQFQLQGLGRSPALGNAVALGMSDAMVPLIQGDLANRLQAAQLAQGQEALAQQGMGLAAEIAGNEQARQLQALGLAGQLTLGLTDPYARAAELQQRRQELALKGIGSGGELERGVTQEALDAAQADWLRRQSLAEQSTIGLFGGSVLPPTLQQRSKSTSSSSK